MSHLLSGSTVSVLVTSVASGSEDSLAAYGRSKASKHWHGDGEGVGDAGVVWLLPGIIAKRPGQRWELYLDIVVLSEVLIGVPMETISSP
jgi:hypothetical protein